MFVGVLSAVSALSMPSIALSQAIPKNGTAALTGRVVDRQGKAIPYAHIFEILTGTTAITSRLGEFQFPSLGPRDSAILAVRRIGYRPLDTALALIGEEPVRVDLPMDEISKQLEAVTVRVSGSDYDEYLDRSGFYRRMARNVDGAFISSKEIDRRNATALTGLLRDVPGIHVESMAGRGGKNNFVLGRGRICALGLVIDGQKVDIRVPPRENFQPRITSIIGGTSVPPTHARRVETTMDELVPPSMVAAIEIYPSAASVPNPLSHHVDGCGLIAVWTRYQP